MNKEELEKVVEKADKAIELSRFAMKEGAESLYLIFSTALKNDLIAQNLTNCIIRDIESGKAFDEILSCTKQTIESLYVLPEGSAQTFYECIIKFIEGYSNSFSMCAQTAIVTVPIRRLLDYMD